MKHGATVTIPASLFEVTFGQGRTVQLTERQRRLLFALVHFESEHHIPTKELDLRQDLYELLGHLAPDPGSQEVPMYDPNELANRTLALRMAVEHCAGLTGDRPVLTFARAFYNFLSDAPVSALSDPVAS